MSDIMTESVAFAVRILTTSHLAATLTVIALLSVLTLSFHRLYIHPLKSYPGPLLARLTSLPDLYHAYRGDKHIHFLRLHAKYGPVVRFAPDSISVNDPAALRAIYGHGANVQKSESFYHAFRAHPTAISTLLATERVHHARKRRIMGQAFSDGAMKDLEKYVLENVRTWEGEVGCRVDVAMKEGKKWTAGIDMGKWCNYLVFDIMGDLVFGKSFGTLGDRPENRNAIHLLGRAARRNYTIGAMPFLHETGLERWIPPFRGLSLDRQQYFAFAKRQVMERSQNTSRDSSGRKDIFHYLLNAKDPETGEGLPKPELFMEGNTLIVAGSDTSSTTISATLYHLLSNTDCLERLSNEVLSTFDDLEEIRAGVKLQTCTYLRACIDEAMRMSPAVPGLLPRRVLPGGLDIPALNLHIPADVVVGTCTYAIQHHQDFVIEPFTYNPSRWFQRLSSAAKSHRRQRSDSGVALRQTSPSSSDNEAHSSGEADVQQDLQQKSDEYTALHSVFAPFSLGNRACLGKPLVYMEISIAIARLVWKYDMRLVDVPPVDPGVRADVRKGRRMQGEYHLRDWFLSANEGPVVQFAQRRRDS